MRFGIDPFRFLEGVQARFDAITAIPILGRAPLVIVTDPDLAHEVLSRPPEFRRAAEGIRDLAEEIIARRREAMADEADDDGDSDETQSATGTVGAERPQDISRCSSRRKTTPQSTTSRTRSVTR